MPTATRPARPRTAWCGPRRAHVAAGVAAEFGGSYDAGDRGHAGPHPVGPAVPHAPASDGAPDDPPVLAELPDLAAVLADLDVADRAQRSAVVRLAALLRDDEVERTTGVGPDHWLASVARLTRMDRRLLVRTCRLLHRLPTLAAAVEDGRVSFAQLRGLAIALRTARRELDAEVDRLLRALLDGLGRMERPDPDVLVRQVTDALDEFDPDDLADRERDARAGRFLAIQPRLDGTGGAFTGELDAVGLALLDATTAPTPAQIAVAGGVGTARADLLLARLAGTAVADTRSAADAPDVADAADAAHAPLPPPQVVARLRFETLLDPAVPGELLTSLLGGRLKLTGEAARRLLDERGSLLRTVVVDDAGAVLGVGRATRQPPGWIRDAVAALHDTCSGPGCDRPARGSQQDHAAPWWPVRPDQPPGRTDVDEIGPLCAATNRAKEAAGWRVDQTAAGVRTWRHARSGLTSTTVPSTWRPAGDPRLDTPPGRASPDDACRHRRRPTSPDPPGPDGSGPRQAAPDPRRSDRAAGDRPAGGDQAEPGDGGAGLPF
jgi:hypothetical protein